MSDSSARQAFIDTILSEPHVVSHRLIFADWLEEHGEPQFAKRFRTLPGLAALWAYEWGQDRVGLWATFRIPPPFPYHFVITQKMRWIPPGKFWMGSLDREEGREPHEGPQHLVKVTRGFWLANTPCSDAVWNQTMLDDPAFVGFDTFPTIPGSFDQIKKFLHKVSSQIQGLTLTLPTEAQWEYACRAGTWRTRYHDEIDQISCYAGNCSSGPELKKKLPNPWGLYDMLGGVWEWCRDGMRQYTAEAMVNPRGPMDKSADRVLKGGSWRSEAREVRPACRRKVPIDTRGTDDIGFRVSCPG